MNYKEFKHLEEVKKLEEKGHEIISCGSSHGGFFCFYITPSKIKEVDFDGKAAFKALPLHIKISLYKKIAIEKVKKIFKKEKKPLRLYTTSTEKISSVNRPGALGQRPDPSQIKDK